MGVLKFSLPIKAFSVNAMYYGSIRKKKPACCEWETIVEEYLSRIDELKSLANYKSFNMEYHFFMPGFFNKAGDISAKTYDLTNIEKNLQDMIFKAINTDDRFVVSVFSTKQPSMAYRIDVVINY
jgi:hypothetical protein